MSHNSKPNYTNTAAPYPPQPPEVHPKEREKVEQLISAGDSGKAVDLAKEIHKRRQSPDSEALLVDAYGARIRALAARKLERDARSLMDLVLVRYPSARGRMAEWNQAAAVPRGQLESALQTLNDPSLPPEKLAAIAALVRRQAVDLGALAESRALAPEHPWRIAAVALVKAFEAVTSGPVAEEALALAEVSRQSPLAPWKMLVRAIAAYYRGDNALCQKYLAAIDADSAPALLIPALRSLMHQKAALTPAAAALVRQAGGDRDTLRRALERLDDALRRGRNSQAVEEIRTAVTVCRQSEPELLERLKQHISVRAMLANLKPDSVAGAMAGPSLKDAHFWRLVARAAEDQKGSPAAIPQACSLWEEFRKHAVREGWFPAKGPEVAAVYVHMADLWQSLPEEEREELPRRFAAVFDGHAAYYKNQPPEIRALMPKREPSDLCFLFPMELLRLACEADPCAESFQKWLRCASETSPESGDGVAECWCEALPNDIPPLLHLMQSAEKRNALQKAFKYMERAERIDGVNAEVRRARLRLLVSMATRHLRERKPHLAEKELRQIEALPQAQQGDRLAFVSALRWACSQSGLASPQAAAARADVARLLGSELAAQVVLAGFSQCCALRAIDFSTPPKGAPVAAPIGRACALGDDMGIPFQIPQSLFDRLSRELSVKDFRAPAPALIALGEAAIRQDAFSMAYAIAGAGLAQGTEGQGRFLFLRARGLPPMEDDRRAACLAAASELARRQRDMDLLDRIGACRDEEMEFFGSPLETEAASISTDEINQIVQSESKERSYPRPRTRPSADEDDVCQCPKCRARRNEGLPFGFETMLEELGPEAILEALGAILESGGKKKRRKGRIDFGDDLPF